MSEETKEAAKPTREQFFEWIKEQLKNAGVPEEHIDKIMSVLENAIKTPYPYPYPAPYPQPYPAPAPKQAEESEVALAKPTRAAFLRWFRNQLKKAGLKADDIEKVMGILQEAIKTPYPYPYPKKMEEGEIAEVEEEIEAYKEKIKQLEEELAKYKEAEIKQLANEIKAVDESFDAEKFLEGISCHEVKVKMLAKYKEMVSSLKPTKLTVHEEDDVEAKVKKVLSEWNIDLKSLLGGE